jgi:Zn-finger nucleic acid-binding protein
MAKMCPDDRLPLYERTIHELAVDICLKCGGMWLDRGEIAKVRDMDHEQLQDLDDATPEVQESRSTNPGCPVCSKVLEPFNYCGGEALLERCPELHGIWVPEAQLPKIAKPFSPEAAVLFVELDAQAEASRKRYEVAEQVLRQLTRRYAWSRYWLW